MNKKDFFKQIKNNLDGFEQEEINEIIGYYEEIILDKMEYGLSEEEAIESLGNVKDITNEIKVNIIMKRSDKKSTNSLKNFLIILGICSTPILLPIGITFTVLFFVMFVVLFSLIFSLGVSGVCIIAASVIQFLFDLFKGGELSSMFIYLGVGLLSGAILILLTLEIIKVTKTLLNKTNILFSKMIRKKSKKGDEIDA